MGAVAGRASFASGTPGARGAVTVVVAENMCFARNIRVGGMFYRVGAATRVAGVLMILGA